MKKWKIVGIAVSLAIVGAAVLGVTAYAQSPTTPKLFGLFGLGRGGWMSDYVEQMYNAIANKLGVQRSALDAAIQEAREEVIQQAVADGKITQEQADMLLNPTQAMRDRIEQAVADGKLSREQADWLLEGLEKGFVPYGYGFGFGGRGGHFGGFRGPKGFWGRPGGLPNQTPTPESSGGSSGL